MFGDGASDDGPPRYELGSPARSSQEPAAAHRLTRAVGVRLCLSGPIALVLAGVGTLAAGLVVSAALPSTCTGDSCMVTPGLIGGALSAPLMIYLGWAVALLVLRIRRPWLVALAAAPLSLFLIAAGAVSTLRGDLAAGTGLSAVLAAALPLVGLLIAGPGAGLAAGVTVLGSGWARIVTIPAVVLLVITTGAVVVKVVTPMRQARIVTKYVPHPYRYDDPEFTVRSLDLSSYRKSLGLIYDAADGGGRSIVVTEYRAPDGDLEVAGSQRCAPLADSPACIRVPSAAPTLGLWRTGPNSYSQIVVLRADAVVVVNFSDPPTDQTALDAASRLRPASAADLIASAGSTSIYDFG